MGLNYEGNWKKEDKIFLQENYGKLSNKEIAIKLNRSENSIIHMAYHLKIKNLYRIWSDEEIEILKKYYPLEGKRVANRLPYKTEKQCRSKAIGLKIKYIGSKTSKYKYVHWNKQEKRWRVEFVNKGQLTYIGSFINEDEAGKVAMEKAKEYGKVI